jgi:hypothetical protein
MYHDVKMTRPVVGGSLAASSSVGKPVTVDGDSVYVVLNVGYSSHLWGMKATVSASVDREVVSIPWVVDLLRGVALASSLLCRDVVRGNKLRSSWKFADTAPPAGTVGSKWLTSDLLSAGLGSSVSEASAAGDSDDTTLLRLARSFLETMGGDQTSDSIDAAFGVPALDVDGFLSSVDRVLPVLPHVDGVGVVPEAEGVVAACATRVFAVLLYHNHLGSTLASFVSSLDGNGSSPEIPVEILKCWKAANR